MNFSTKKATTGRRSSSGLITSGVATVTLHQRMTIARKAVAEGSIKSDWKKVGGDVNRAITSIRREFERA